STAPSSSSAVADTCASTPSSASTVTCASTGSGRVRRRSSGWSSRTRSENEVWKACFVSEQPPLERVRPAPLVAELPVQAHRKVDGHAERGRAPLDLHLGARLHVPARSADPAHVPTARARGSRIGGIDAGVELVLALDGRLID